ncbi:MAG: hypothetical protein J2P21_19470 [Chloracidobacterium sp.]|nr:hypothetical protein [Chloracidobacterium sp.]
MVKRFIKTTLMTGIPFGLALGAFFALFDAMFGLMAGLASGLLFGLIIAAFVEYQRRKMESGSGMFENEAVILQGPANHFMKMEGRGGWLTLTPTRLAFRSHGNNIQNDPVDIHLNEIDSVSTCMTAGIIPNGLKVVKKDGASDRFVVPARRDWVRVISETLPKT